MTEITAVVPTLATAERAPYLNRAIDSILGQGVPVRIVVVVNGPQADRAIVERLAERAEVDTVRLADASLPGALLAGRKSVTSQFFFELDDDDHLVPGALSAWADVLQRRSSVDVVIGNAVMRSPAGERPSMPDVAAVRARPLDSLMDKNWLVPGSAMMRTDAVGPDYFEAMPEYLEWTYLGLRLASEKQLQFIDRSVCVHSEGLPFSTNESLDCLLERPVAAQSLRRLQLPAHIKRRLAAKECALWHAVAEHHLAHDDRRAAWRAHLCSIRSPFGWRFIPFTRKLLL